jgi:nucleoid-associated protein YgaU
MGTEDRQERTVRWLESLVERLESYSKDSSRSEDRLELAVRMLASLVLLIVLLAVVLVGHPRPVPGRWSLLLLILCLVAGMVLSSIPNLFDSFLGPYRLLQLTLLVVIPLVTIVLAWALDLKRLDWVFVAAGFGAIVGLLVQNVELLPRVSPDLSTAFAAIPIVLLVLSLAGWLPSSYVSPRPGPSPSPTTVLPPSSIAAPGPSSTRRAGSAAQVAEELAVQVAPPLAKAAADVVSEAAKTGSGTILDAKKLAVDTLAVPFFKSLSDETGKIVVRRLDQATSRLPATAKAAADDEARLQLAVEMHRRLVEELRGELAASSNSSVRDDSNALAEVLATAITERLLIRLSTQAPETPGSQPPSQPSPAARYTVRPGDSLWGLSRKLLGPTASAAEIDRMWRALYATNRPTIGNSPDLIIPGQVLKLPGELVLQP